VFLRFNSGSRVAIEDTRRLGIDKGGGEFEGSGFRREGGGGGGGDMKVGEVLCKKSLRRVYGRGDAS